jgi:P-type Na+/K+ transporter
VLKRITTVYERKSDSQCVYFTKGALERVLAVCRVMCVGDERVSLTPEAVAGINSQLEAFASQGMRVLAFATKTVLCKNGPRNI